jgi:hypothetical protein
VKNQELQRVADIFVGDWSVSITNQRWVDDKTATTRGLAKGEWLEDAFVQLRMWFEGEGNELFGNTAVDQAGDLGHPQMHFVFGRSDARDRFLALSHDERGVLRVFDLALEADTWTLHRGDPDFHQRLVGRVDGNSILIHPDISEDQGATWVKDFDMTLARV